ncbi:MAG: helix-turn-helix transcriptional regulator [Paraprevotella clara]|uniref:Peptidase S24-like protein n=2 Tax=Paraprevotella clara TaxID=454154 RepID=A0A6N3EXI9_9BACT
MKNNFKKDIDTSNMPYANKKVYELIQKETNGNVRAFAQSINVSQQVLNRIFCIDKRNGKYPSVSNDIKKGIIEVYDKDEIWFIADIDSNESEMSKHSSEEENNKELDGVEGKAIPLLPVSAQGGRLNDFIVSVRESDCEKVVSPIKDADFAIPVSGDSMAPEYPNGSQVHVKKINENAFIEWGRVYVLDTCNGAVIKRIVPSEREGCVKCLSINPDPIYAPFEVNLDDVYGIYRVMLCLSIK